MMGVRIGIWWSMGRGVICVLRGGCCASMRCGWMGVSLARGIGALNLGMIGKIFLSWIITLPAGAILSITFFFILRALFGGV